MTSFGVTPQSRGGPAQPIVPRERVYHDVVTRVEMDAAVKQATFQSYKSGYEAGYDAGFKYGVQSGKAELSDAAAMGKWRMEALLTEVSEKHHMKPAVLLGNSRTKPISRARQEFMFRAVHELGRSTTEIGRFLGGKDHTTIVHGARRHRARIDAGEA